MVTLQRITVFQQQSFLVIFTSITSSKSRDLHVTLSSGRKRIFLFKKLYISYM